MELICPPHWLTSSMCGFLPTLSHPTVTPLFCQVICEGWAWWFMRVNRDPGQLFPALRVLGTFS